MEYINKQNNEVGFYLSRYQTSNSQAQRAEKFYLGRNNSFYRGTPKIFDGDDTIR